MCVRGRQTDRQTVIDILNEVARKEAEKGIVGKGTSPGYAGLILAKAHSGSVIYRELDFSAV